MAVRMEDVTGVVAGKGLRIVSNFITEKLLQRPEIGDFVTMAVGLGSAMFGPRYFPTWSRQLEVGGVVALVDGLESFLRKKGVLTYEFPEEYYKMPVEVLQPVEKKREELVEIA